MNDSRSLKFLGRTGPKPYDAHIEVQGAVSGIKFGSLLLSRKDLAELSRLCQHLSMVLEEGSVTSGVVA